MRHNPIVRVLASVPVDRKAAMVAPQGRCSNVELVLDRDELLELIARTQRKQRLLKLILSIRTQSQHNNLVKRSRKGVTGARPKRAVDEYLRLGASMQLLMARVAHLNRIVSEPRRLLGHAENEWKKAHPGCIWDGSKLVAPNGDTFSRSAAAGMVEVH